MQAMRCIVKTFRRRPTGRNRDRNGGLPRLSDGVAHPCDAPASPQRTLLAENLGKPARRVMISAPWYKHGLRGYALPGMGANGADRLNRCQRSPRREVCGAAVRGRTDGFMKIAGGSAGGPLTFASCHIRFSKILACFMEKPCDLPGNTGNWPTTDGRPWLGHQTGSDCSRTNRRRGIQAAYACKGRYPAG